MTHMPRLRSIYLVAAVTLIGWQLVGETTKAQPAGRRFPVISGLIERADQTVRKLLPGLAKQLPALSRSTQRQADGELHWHDQYGVAYEQAKQQQRMLLVNFVPSSEHPDQVTLERVLAARPAWCQQLSNFVLVRVPLEAEVKIQGHPQRLIAHRAFAEMHNQPGIAIVDLAHSDRAHYGHVVSAFPFMRGKYYRWRTEYLPVVLSLPPGTISQRTMVWAVRTHPERPASTNSVMDPRLAEAARAHSTYQARLGVQGHHGWETRSHGLRALGGSPVEVVAESWPGQTMIDSCVDCVASWRQSSGHWNAVRSPHAMYAYDIRFGRNRIWYATGIFVSRS